MSTPIPHADYAHVGDYRYGKVTFEITAPVVPGVVTAAILLGELLKWGPHDIVLRIPCSGPA